MAPDSKDAVNPSMGACGGIPAADTFEPGAIPPISLDGGGVVECVGCGEE